MAMMEDARERKRRFEPRDYESVPSISGIGGARYSSNSPPNRSYPRQEWSGRSQYTVNGASPSHLPPLNSMTSAADEDAQIKRRRLENAGDVSQGSIRSREVEYAEGGADYRRGSLRSAAHDHFIDDHRYAPPAPAHVHPSSSSSDRRSIGEDSFDSSVPLARRRGDAAQAKASRLHIDTGSGSTAAGEAPRDRISSHPPLHGARSAPPYKATFSEREAPYDYRGEAPQRGYGYGYEGPGNSNMVRRDGPDSLRDAASSRRNDGPPGLQSASHPSGALSSAYRGPGPISTTPLTSTRNTFVPQTATLPSPAYHTTQFVRQAGHSGNVGGTAGTAAGGPRTAGLGPPGTARLPEHLRSPPSSKTQFLSLFSNFYDSLQDSRTLKVTLEDQVRRSNTLLQTLQKSARVLELTVERRLSAERSVWEKKVQALEERCRRLERATGAGSPTPPQESESNDDVNRNGSGAIHESKSDAEADEGDKVSGNGVATAVVAANEDQPEAEE